MQLCDKIATEYGLSVDEIKAMPIDSFLIKFDSFTDRLKLNSKK